jgi:hypothetical protein
MSSTRNATASGLAESTQQQQQIGGDEANRGVACCFKKQTDSDPKQSGDKYREQRAPRTHRWRKRERLISTGSFYFVHNC